MIRQQNPAPAHAPDTRGPLRRLLGDYHVTGVFWYRFHHWGASIFPEWGIHFSVFLFTSFFFIVLRRIRKAIANNLEAVLGPCGWWRRQLRIWRTMWTYAWCLTERYESLSTDLEISLTTEGEDHWQEVVGTERGLVVVTAHIGHWEIGSRLGLTGSGRRVHLVREPELDPRAQKFIREVLMRAAGPTFEVHFASETDLTLGARLLVALREGDVVALQGDRPRAGGRSCVAKLFGRSIELPAGPAAIARAAGVPLVPVFIFREGRHQSRVIIRRPILATPSNGGAEDLQASVQQIASDVEWAIRREPHQWFCFRELWPASGGF